MSAKIEEIDKLRKKRARKIFFKRLVIFLLTAAMIFALFIGMRYASDYDIGGFISDTINSIGSGPGFPLDFAGNTVNAMYPVKNAVALLTDTGLYIYKNDAKELSHTYFDYSDPIVISGRNRFFIYDCFGYNYRIESKSDTVLEKTTDEKLICADYSRSGHIALVSESSRCLALLTVLDKNNNEIFTWTSTENYITGCSLSPDGKTVAVSGITTSGGMLRSVVISFNVSGGNENFRKYYDNTLIYDLTSLSRSRVCVIMEDNAVLLSQNGNESQSFNYSGRTLTGFQHGEDGSYVLIFHEDGSNDQNVVTYLDSDCTERFTLNKIGAVRDIYVDSNALYILNDNELSYYNGNGELTKSAALSADVYCFTVSGNNIYAATNSAIVELELEYAETVSQSITSPASDISMTDSSMPSESAIESDSSSEAFSSVESESFSE